ncbi:hypothetical protein F5Y15DRAFT_331230 [Xylariaceae sp. FL0016]|nr:hypothetical protein F5Y15DRAFT_331230 [Xylariaceae sp. FL0016]
MPLETIRFCGICDKPISTESAYTRHTSYCRRRQGRPKKRNRSCKACHAAKTRCSFQSPCSRCQLKGLDCAYEKVRPRTVSGQDDRKHMASEPSVPVGRSAHPEPLSSRPLARFRDTPKTSASPSARRSYPASFTDASLDRPASAPRLATELSADASVQSSASLLLETIRGLPLMMCRRETFPDFVHKHWDTGTPQLPENLIQCVEIARLYADAEHDKSRFLTAMEDENKRLLRRLPEYDAKEDVLAGIQAQLVYIVMYALDNGTADTVLDIRLQMLMTLEYYCIACHKMDNFAPYDISQMDDPKETWEEWIYAETRRRCAITFFLFSRIVDVKFGATCYSVLKYRSLPLPSPGHIWQARTREEWRAAREIHREESENPLKTFGDLVDARKEPPETESGRQLSEWHSRCDRFGLLLTVATSMV